MSEETSNQFLELSVSQSCIASDNQVLDHTNVDVLKDDRRDSRSMGQEATTKVHDPRGVMREIARFLGRASQFLKNWLLSAWKKDNDKGKNTSLALNRHSHRESNSNPQTTIKFQIQAPETIPIDFDGLSKNLLSGLGRSILPTSDLEPQLTAESQTRAFEMPSTKAAATNHSRPSSWSNPACRSQAIVEVEEQPLEEQAIEAVSIGVEVPSIEACEDRTSVSSIEEMEELIASVATHRLEYPSATVDRRQAQVPRPDSQTLPRPVPQDSQLEPPEKALLVRHRERGSNSELFCSKLDDIILPHRNPSGSNTVNYSRPGRSGRIDAQSRSS